MHVTNNLIKNETQGSSGRPKQWSNPDAIPDTPKQKSRPQAAFSFTNQLTARAWRVPSPQCACAAR